MIISWLELREMSIGKCFSLLIGGKLKRCLLFEHVANIIKRFYFILSRKDYLLAEDENMSISS